MLNKKLVLAALLGAALAEGETGTPEESGTPAPEESGTPAPEESGTPAPEETGTPKEEVEEKEEEEEGLSRVWKEVMPDESVMVLCDQGESALWEDAKLKLVDLALA